MKTGWIHCLANGLKAGRRLYLNTESRGNNREQHRITTNANGGELLSHELRPALAARNLGLPAEERSILGILAAKTLTW